MYAGNKVTELCTNKIKDLPKEKKVLKQEMRSQALLHALLPQP